MTAMTRLDKMTLSLWGGKKSPSQLAKKQHSILWGAALTSFINRPVDHLIGLQAYRGKKMFWSDFLRSKPSPAELDCRVVKGPNSRQTLLSWDASSCDSCKTVSDSNFMGLGSKVSFLGVDPRRGEVKVSDKTARGKCLGVIFFLHYRWGKDVAIDWSGFLLCFCCRFEPRPPHRSTSVRWKYFHTLLGRLKNELLLSRVRPIFFIFCPPAYHWTLLILLPFIVPPGGLEPAFEF